MNAAMKQILDNAVVSDGVIHVFALAQLDEPGIAQLLDGSLEDVRKTPTKKSVFELPERLGQDTIRRRSRTNLVKEKNYTDRLTENVSQVSQPSHRNSSCHRRTDQDGEGSSPDRVEFAVLPMW